MSLDEIILQNELDAITGSLLEEVMHSFLTFKMFQEAYLISEVLAFYPKVVLAKAIDDPIFILNRNYEIWLDNELVNWSRTHSLKSIKEDPFQLLKFKLVELFTFLDQGRQLGITNEAYKHTNLRKVFDRACINKMLVGKEPKILLEIKDYPQDYKVNNGSEYLRNTKFELVTSYIEHQFKDDYYIKREGQTKTILIAADKYDAAKKLEADIDLICFSDNVETTDHQYVSFKCLKPNEKIPDAVFCQSKKLFDKGIYHNFKQNNNTLALISSGKMNNQELPFQNNSEFIKKY